jgi:Zn-finger nucleic acid-binding protein
VDDNGPYRSASSLTATCPRCHTTLASTGDTTQLVCPAGCGEWYALGTLVSAIELARAKPDDMAGWPWGLAACPICRRPMRVRVREAVRFDHCEAHGIWLDAGEYRQFVEAFRRR